MKVRATDQPPALIFTEKASLCAQLEDVDVQFLLEHHRAHLDLRPAGQVGYYLLTSRGHVGILAAPKRRIVIRPKTPLPNLFLMLDPTTTDSAVPDPKLPRRREELLDFLVCQLAARFRKQQFVGPSEASRSSFFSPNRNTLSVPPPPKSATQAKEQSVAPETTLNSPWNQIIVSLVEHMLASTLLGARYWETLSHSLDGFENVTRVAVTPDACSALLKEPMPEGFRPLIDLSRTIVAALPHNGEGQSPPNSFLLPMGRIFEQYVTRGIRAAFAEELDSISIHPWYRLRSESRSTPVVAFCPDCTIERTGRPLINVQVRWGRPPRDGLITADVHRALAYTAALGVRRSILVFPSGKDQLWEYDIPCGPATLEIRTLCVTGDVAQCRLSLHRLGRHLQRIWSAKDRS